MEMPGLPAGHRHLWTPRRALSRGYWLVCDPQGYEYALGCTASKDAQGEISTTLQPDGTERKWRKDGNGSWAETTASTCTTRWLDRVPPRLRCSGPWMLPNGHRAAGNPRVKDAVEGWCRDPHRGERPLYLHGPAGTGKSQTAVWTGLILAGMGTDADWLHFGAAAQAMRASYSGERTEFEGQMRRWLSCPVLVVDDIGAEGAGKDVAELLYRLADSRYNACLPTVWTSNIGPMLLTNSGIDPRTASRIGSGIAVELTGKDRRAS